MEAKKIIPRIILGLVLLSGAYYAYQKYQFAQKYEVTDNAQVETTFVPVLPRVGGFVKSVAVNDYDKVTKGQTLVTIDTDETNLAVAELQANYQTALTDVENAKASISQTNLSIASAEANMKTWVVRLNKAKADADRETKLFADNAITRRQYDDARGNQDLVQSQSDGAQSDIVSSKSKIPVLQANLHKAEASLGVLKAKIDQQKLRLTYGEVVAPESGKIGKKTVQVGQYIQPGVSLMTIVQDSTYWVIANFKETQISRLRVGNEVEITLDAYANQPLKGKIASISESTGAKSALLPPDNASGNFVKVTQRIPVKIEILDVEKNRDILRAGMSAEVRVSVKN